MEQKSRKRTDPGRETKIGRAAQTGRLWTIWSSSSHRAARPGPVNDSRASPDRQAAGRPAAIGLASWLVALLQSRPFLTPESSGMFFSFVFSKPRKMCLIGQPHIYVYIYTHIYIFDIYIYRERERERFVLYYVP